MAIKANLIIDQGVDYSTTIELTNDNGEAVSLSGYSAQAQMRKTYTSLNAVSFSVTLADSLGAVILGLSANTTANMTPGRFVYDVLLTNNIGVKSRIVEGIVTLTPRVTK
jgi:hypothetical protein